MESYAPLCFSFRMEDYRAFALVTVLTSKPGKMIGINSAYDDTEEGLQLLDPARYGLRGNRRRSVLSVISSRS